MADNANGKGVGVRDLLDEYTSLQFSARSARVCLPSHRNRSVDEDD